jgi:hypothetical protein
LNHVHSVPAAAHHKDAFTRLDLRPIARRSNARWHATSNEAGEIKRDVLIDHDDRGPIYYGVFGKSTDHTKRADSNSLPVSATVRAVELRPLGDARAFSAKMMQTLTTPSANSTGRDEG